MTSALYGVLGTVGLLGLVWLIYKLGSWAGERVGKVQAQMDALTDGAEKERRADEIMAEPIRDRTGVLDGMRKQRPSP